MSAAHKKADDIDALDFSSIRVASEEAEFNNKSFLQRITIILSHDEYRRVIPLILLWVTAGYMPAVFWNAWVGLYILKLF